MNRLQGTIIAIDSNRHMSLVDVAVGQDMFSATLLETPETAGYLKAGSPVTLLFKETEVALAKGLHGIVSLRNRFTVTVQEIERGNILSAIRLDYGGHVLTSIITTRAVAQLQLVVGDQVEALIKANEIALMEGHRDA